MIVRFMQLYKGADRQYREKYVRRRERTTEQPVCGAYFPREYGKNILNLKEPLSRER